MYNYVLCAIIVMMVIVIYLATTTGLTGKSRLDELIQKITSRQAKNEKQ